MKPEFTTYLEGFGITFQRRPELYSKIESIHDFFQAECPDEIADVFLADYTSDGRRVYPSLWFFTPKFALEARNLEEGEQAYYMSIIRGNVVSCEFYAVSYNRQKANDASIFSVHVVLGTHGGLSLRATKENCDKLKQIYEQYVKPNFVAFAPAAVGRS
jgi:hypothetical protein